jgi:hypothetical protein
MNREHRACAFSGRTACLCVSESVFRRKGRPLLLFKELEERMSKIVPSKKMFMDTIKAQLAIIKPEFLDYLSSKFSDRISGLELSTLIKWLGNAKKRREYAKTFIHLVVSSGRIDAYTVLKLFIGTLNSELVAFIVTDKIDPFNVPLEDAFKTWDDAMNAQEKKLGDGNTKPMNLITHGVEIGILLGLLDYIDKVADEDLNIRMKRRQGLIDYAIMTFKPSKDMADDEEENNKLQE